MQASRRCKNLVYLRFVANKIDFWLAWLRGCRLRQHDGWQRVGLLNQHIDQSFLFVGRLDRNHRQRERRFGGRFDENDAIMLLRCGCS